MCFSSNVELNTTAHNHLLHLLHQLQGKLRLLEVKAIHSPLCPLLTLAEGPQQHPPHMLKHSAMWLDPTPKVPGSNPQDAKQDNLDLSLYLWLKAPPQ